MSYLASVCAQYGIPFNENRPDEDFLGMDATIECHAAPIRVQVKCTTSAFSQQDYLRIPVNSDWVEKWKRNKTPAFLVAVQVDRQAVDWIDYDVENETLHRSSAYWTRVDNITDVNLKSLHIPKGNRFTAETIRDWQDLLMQGFGA